LCLNTQAFALDVGDPVPDFELPQSQVALKLSDLNGKWVYLDFWASWCTPCRQSFPWMNQMQLKYGSKDFQILAVNLDAKKTDADRFLTQTPANFSLAFDSKAQSAKLMELKGMPTSYLINPQGKLVYIHTGFRNEDRELLESKFKKLTTNQ
jgi:cytochrome c biogenesis protein CcmG, thiol:disulfide interchange protein DsbE